MNEATLRMLADAEEAAAAIMRAGPIVAADIAVKFAAILSALARYQHAAASRPALPAPTAPLLTAKEAATHLGLTPARLYELTRAGRVPAERIGQRQVRYDLGKVRDALARN